MASLFLITVILSLYPTYSSTDETHTLSPSTLRLVHVMFRHGDRSPTHTYPTDPHQVDAWPQGWGQLTQIGMRQEGELGGFLRKRYAGYLSAKYVRSEIHIQSTDKDRTIMSAYCMLSSLYVPQGDQIWNQDILWQPIPVHNVPLQEDFLLYLHCPTYDKLYKELMESPEVKNLTEKYKDLIEYTSAHSGLGEPTFHNLMEMVDPIYCENVHQKHFPDWLLVNNTVDKILALKSLKAQLKVKTKPMQKIRGGPVLGQMLKNMKNFVHNGNITEKMFVYSAHDTNVNAFLRIIDQFNRKNPPYSSCIIVELHEVQPKSYGVKIFFRNDTRIEPYLLTIPGCSSTCPLSRLEELTKDMIPENPRQECLGKDNLHVREQPPTRPTRRPSTTAATNTSGPANNVSFHAIERSDIECTSRTMKIFVPKRILPNHQATMRDPNCTVTFNGTHHIVEVGLNDCGTTVEFTNTSVIFRNELNAHLASGNSQSKVNFGNDAASTIPIECDYDRMDILSLHYLPVKRHVRFFEKRYGHLDFHIGQADSDQFTHEIPASSYPLKVPLSDKVFIRVKLDNTQRNDVGIYADNCIATSSPSPADPMWYQILQNGCPASRHVSLHKSPAVNEVRFSFDAFEFRYTQSLSSATVSTVYIHCEVSACPLVECTPHCNTATSAPLTPHGRRRRGATGRASHLVSTGPLLLMGEEESPSSSTIVAAVSVSVAVVASVVAVIYLVTRKRGQPKYQIVPLEESN